jgi:hypothetical protein
VAVSRWQPLWLLLSFGLALAVNHLMRPRVAYELSPGERTMTTGGLHIDDWGGPQDFKLATIHLVTGQVRRPLAEPFVVRELWMRSPEQDGQGGPDLELFVDFGAPGAEPRGPGDITGRDLPVLPAAAGGSARSRIRFVGAEKALSATQGHVRLREALPTEVASNFRVEGELELLLPTDNGPRSLHGRFNARLVWDQRP